MVQQRVNIVIFTALLTDTAVPVTLKIIKVDALRTCPLLSPKYLATGSPAWILISWFSLSLLGRVKDTTHNGS
jgi:hypothetical protein